MKSALSLSLMVVFLLAASVSSASAQLLKHIERVIPRIGQRGTTIEVTIQGTWLREIREVMFSTPGIRVVETGPLESLPHPIGLAHGGRIEEQVRCQVEIAVDCQPGEHHFRIRTTDQLSTLATFHVSPFPVVDEVDSGNSSIATAMPVQPNVTIRRNHGAGDVHLFKVPATAGTRLSAEIDAVRIADVHYGDSEFDLALRVLDANGRELAANDDNALHLQDPLVSLQLPDDLPGDSVFVEVSPSVAGQGSVPYCLHLGNFRRPLAVYPAGGPAGTSQTVHFFGDPLGHFEESVVIPETVGTFAWFGEAPSPLLMRASPFPNVLEDEAGGVTAVGDLPCAVNGRLEAPGDTDVFLLSVKKGDRYRVRVYAAALGSSIDAALRIWSLASDGTRGPVELDIDDADTMLADREIFGPNFRSRGGLKDVLDPSVVWEPAADGEYLLEVRDTNGFGEATGIYRVELEPPEDRIYVQLATGGNSDWVEATRYMGLAVPQGNRWTVNVNLPQGQGNTWRGGLQIVGKDLPRGVTLVSPSIPPGQSRWPVQLVADASCEPRGALISLAVMTTEPGKTIGSGFQQWVPFINHSGGDAWRAVRCDRAIMAVTDPAPISIDLVAPTITLVRGGELAIPVKLSRHFGFIDAVDFQCEFAPPGVSLPPAETIAAAATEATLRITADQNAPLGSGPLFVRATTLPQKSSDLGTGRVMVTSEIIMVTIGEAFLELSSQPASIRRGAKGHFSFSVIPKTPFDGEATARLLGLPKGVHMLNPPPVVTKDSKEILFNIEATDEALPGAVSGISCEIIVRAADQEIRQRAGNGTLRIDPRL